MQKLISELSRLYLPAAAVPAAVLEQHLRGQANHSVNLLTADGLTRAMLIAFPRMPDSEEAHWTLLCTVANAMQAELGLPAAAVSISGADGYGLWLSLAAALPSAHVEQFLALLRARYFPSGKADTSAQQQLLELPPCLHAGTGKWAAFIHPDLGASFASEAGLDMAPPCAGQAALLEGLHSISQTQFEHALNLLAGPAAEQTAVGEPFAARTPAQQDLLLKDASLEDIVRHLHAQGIEPTFRHLIPGKT